jgi:hypothetical protein
MYIHSLMHTYIHIIHAGIGRFCSKSCRYEAHALNVAQQRRTNVSVIATTAATPGNEQLKNAVSAATPLGLTQGILLPLSLALALAVCVCVCVYAGQ